MVGSRSSSAGISILVARGNAPERSSGASILISVHTFCCPTTGATPSAAQPQAPHLLLPNRKHHTFCCPTTSATPSEAAPNPQRGFRGPAGDWGRFWLGKATWDSGLPRQSLAISSVSSRRRFTRSIRCGIMATAARKRWLIRFFSSAVTSAKVRPSSSVGTNKGS